MESSTSTSSSDSDYTTIWTAPPKKPSGRTKFRETRHPVYKGVRRRGTSDRWVCEVRNPNDKTRIWLGTFPTAEMAARAHDVAVMALLGRSACLNFADSAWLIKPPGSFSSVNDIKRAAIEAAENFGYRTEDVCSSVSVSASTSTDCMSNGEKYYGAFSFDGSLDMDLGPYYASLAEGLLMEPPRDTYCNLEDEGWCDVVSLWS